MGLFDSHSHLNDEKFDEDREEQIKKIRESGVSNFITAGYSVESSKKALEIAKKYDFIYTTAGVSPNDIPQTEEELWKQLAEIEKIVENKINVSFEENRLHDNTNITDITSVKIGEEIIDPTKYSFADGKLTLSKEF